VYLDIAVVVAYSSAMLLVGWRARRQSGESYWVADRKYGTSRVSASLLITVFGATATMGVVSLGYERGLTGVWYPLTGAVALVPFGFFLAGRVRDLGVHTLPDILQRAYGNDVSVPAALLIAISWCGVIAAQMLAGASLLSGVFPVSFVPALGVVAVVFVIYTFWGGQLSVVRTDFWQLFLFLGGLLICANILLADTVGSGLSIRGAVPDGHLSFPVSEQFGWYELLVYYPLVVGLPFLVGPDLFSRVFCAKDGATARRSAFIAAAAIVPIAFLLVSLGLLIRALFPEIPPDTALPTALDSALPAGLKGIAVAAFLAAIMSSADTTLVTASTILSLNVIAPTRRKTESQRLWLTRASLIVLGICSWLVAGFVGGIIPALLLGFTIYIGGLVVPTLASFFRERIGVTANGAKWAVIVGGTTALLGGIDNGSLLRALVGVRGNELLQMLLGPSYPSILPLTLSLILILAVSKLSPGKNG